MVPIDANGRASFAVACPKCKVLRDQAFSLDDLPSLLGTDEPLYCHRCDYRWNADEGLKAKIPAMLKQLEQQPELSEQSESLSPNDSNLLRDEIKGRTTEHSDPPRLGDEGQSRG